MFGFRLISRGRGAVGRSGSGRMLFWGLALVPLLGWGQVIIEEPQDATVCVGKNATFMSVTDQGFSGWRINGTRYGDLPDEISNQIHESKVITPEDFDRLTLTVEYNKTFDGLMVQSVVVETDSYTESGLVYVIYKSNQQFPAINPGATVNRTGIHVNWQASETLVPKAYYLSIRDVSAAEPVSVTCNDCQNITGTDYHFYPVIDEASDRCHTFEIRVTEVQLLHPECLPIEQTEYASVVARIPDISPVTIGYADRAVRVNWRHNGKGPYRIEVTDLSDNSLVTLTTHNDAPPYYFLPESCDRDYHLNFAITPAECTDKAFTHQASHRFYSDCLTIARAQFQKTGDDDVPGASSVSGTHWSALLLVMALIPLLSGLNN